MNYYATFTLLIAYKIVGTVEVQYNLEEVTYNKFYGTMKIDFSLNIIKDNCICIKTCIKTPNYCLYLYSSLINN